MAKRADTAPPLGVTFDLWLTLIAEPDGTARSEPRQNMRMELIHKRLVEAGHGVERSLVDEKFQEVYQAIVADQELGHDAPFEARVDALLGGIGSAIGTDLGGMRAEVGKVIDEAFFRMPPQLVPDALETLRAVEGMGHRVGMISNSGFNSPEMYSEWLRRVGIAQHMRYIFISNAHGCAKPNEHAFELASNALEVAPERMLHIGDNPITDVGGAKAYGMCTVLTGGADDSASGLADFKVGGMSEVPDVVVEWARSVRRRAS